MDDEPSEYVDFMVKYKGWLAIKRLGIREHTTPQEVVMHLSSIRGAIDSRMYKMLGIDTDSIDTLAAELTSGKKGPEAIGDSIRAAEQAPIKGRISAACSTSTATRIAQIYLANKILFNLNVDVSLTPAIMAKLYPELKLSTPKGVGVPGRKKKPKTV